MNRTRIPRSWRRASLAFVALVLAAGGVAVSLLPRHGIVRNESQHVLWVVETDTGTAVAHLLGPGRQSPATLDADGVQTKDDSPIRGHRSWWKARDVSVATITETAGVLDLSCFACKLVLDDEFGPVRFDTTPGWGESLAP